MGIPRWVYRASMRLRSLLRGKQLDRELDEELEFHLERAVEANLARGLSPAAARRQALLAVGGIQQRKEECRDTRRVRWIEDGVRDVRYALRTLRRAPAFTTASIATLTLGIGITVAMFTTVNGILIRPMPFPDADRLHLISLSERSVFMPQPAMADRHYLAFRERTPVFEHLAAFTSYKGNLTGSGDAVVITVGLVTSEFFDALGVPAVLGRTFMPEEGQDGRERTIVLSDRLWRTRFGSDPAIVGTALTLDGLQRTVVGVMPEGFAFPPKAEAWTAQVIKIAPRNLLMFPVLGRLKPGVTRGEANAALQTFATTLDDVATENRARWTVGVLPLKELLVADIRRPLQIFAGAVLLVLLIAGANVANLLLARAAGREREMAVRAALGGSRARLIRQLLTESVLLSMCGAAAGIVLARWLVPTVLAFAPADRIPRTEMVRIDAFVVAFAIGVALAIGVLFGLAPALRLTMRRLSPTLLPGGRSTGDRQERLRAMVVTGQVALALVLLTGAGLLGKSFLRLRAVDPGFRADNVVQLSVDLPETVYSSTERLHAFHRDLLERLAGTPDVVAAAAVNWLPLGGVYIKGDFAAEGRAEAPQFDVDKPAVSPGYFRAMGIRVLRGREFDAHDTATSTGVAIVSRTVAKALDPSEDVVGKRVSLKTPPGPNDWLTVVGVVDDIKQLGPLQASHAAVYQPYLQVRSPFLLTHMTYVIRTATDPLRAIPAIRAALRTVDKDQPATSIGLMNDVLNAATAEPGFYARILGAFALLALVLALVGTYGVIAYSVAQRRHEIGVRMALGARDSAVLWMVLRSTLTLGAAGVVVGTAGAWVATRLLRTFLFETTPTDPPTFVAVALTVFVAAVLAGLIPARRATRLDPLVALRHE